MPPPSAGEELDQGEKESSELRTATVFKNYEPLPVLKSVHDGEPDAVVEECKEWAFRVEEPMFTLASRTRSRDRASNASQSKGADLNLYTLDSVPLFGPEDLKRKNSRLRTGKGHGLDTKTTTALYFLANSERK
eukprot:Clim_evm24s247 gene=Clim_evmTU24s247